MGRFVVVEVASLPLGRQSAVGENPMPWTLALGTPYLPARLLLGGITMTHKFCRECGTADPQEKIKLFDVRRDDGDYPGTYLCRACVQEYRLDGHTCRPVKEPNPAGTASVTTGRK